MMVDLAKYIIDGDHANTSLDDYISIPKGSTIVCLGRAVTWIGRIIRIISEKQNLELEVKDLPFSKNIFDFEIHDSDSDKITMCYTKQTSNYKDYDIHKDIFRESLEKQKLGVPSIIERYNEGKGDKTIIFDRVYDGGSLVSIIHILVEWAKEIGKEKELLQSMEIRALVTPLIGSDATDHNDFRKNIRNNVRSRIEMEKTLNSKDLETWNGKHFVSRFCNYNYNIINSCKVFKFKKGFFEEKIDDITITLDFIPISKVELYLLSPGKPRFERALSYEEISAYEEISTGVPYYPPSKWAQPPENIELTQEQREECQKYINVLKTILKN